MSSAVTHADSFLQTMFSVDNFIHYMTASLEMLMNEVRLQDRCGPVGLSKLDVSGGGGYLCVTGSSYDCQRGPDPAHAPFEGGAEAHTGLPAPEVSSQTEGCLCFIIFQAGSGSMCLFGSFLGLLPALCE